MPGGVGGARSGILTAPIPIKGSGETDCRSASQARYDGRYFNRGRGPFRPWRNSY